ncbi:MAG: hypothetical protein ACTSPG_10135 [Candidatus Hodarchaeales archaeon]
MRISRAGNPTSNLFVIAKSKNGPSLRRIVLQGDVADAYKRVTLGCKYRVKLGQFQGGKDFVADNRTVFENPVLLKNMSLQDIMEKLNIPRITIAEAPKHPSKIGSDGYMVMTDWRVIRGIIAMRLRGKKDDGTEWALYRISDETVSGEPTVTPDGTVIRPGLGVWLAPELQVYAEDSECDFYGTIRVSKDTGVASMNCYLIIPIHGKKIATEEE